MKTPTCLRLIMHCHLLNCTIGKAAATGGRGRGRGRGGAVGGASGRGAEAKKKVVLQSGVCIFRSILQVTGPTLSEYEASRLSCRV